MSESPVILVTGATGGLGSAIARAFAAAGCRLALHYASNDAAAQALAGELGDTLAVRGDVAEDAECRRVVQAVLARFGRIDGLVNNAAITRFVRHGDLDALTAADFRAILDVNLIGAWQMARAASAALKLGALPCGGGAIVNVSSGSGLHGGGSSMAYAASKGALNTLTLSLARALAPAVRVNAVAPSMIDSDWLRRGLGEAGYDAARAGFTKRAPLARVASTAEVAEAVVWLVLRSPNMTGEILRMDGGSHLG